MNPVFSKQEIANAILKYERARDRDKGRYVDFTENEEANKLVNDNPLAYLFGVIFDYHILAETAWQAPYRLHQRLGHLDPEKIIQIPDDKLESIFRKKPALHRYYVTAAKRIKDASQQVIDR
jgi:uncharacterized HhH-GPD family protein